MPLVVKDYLWEETPTTVAINVPLKGVKKHKVDVFSTDEFIKVKKLKVKIKKIVIFIIIHVLL